MSIDEVMDRADLYRIAFDTDLAGDRYQVLRAAIEQHLGPAAARQGKGEDPIRQKMAQMQPAAGRSHHHQGQPSPDQPAWHT